MMTKKIMVLGLVGALGMTTAACNQTGGISTGQGVGTVAGAVAGGLLGSTVGRGSGRTAAIIGGAALGGLLGGAIGSSLDARDQQLAYNAQSNALAMGRPTQWRSPQSGYYGTVVPGQAYYNGPSYCREYTHTVYISGRPQKAYGTACRQPDGTWQIVS
jgi:surface antigen